MNKKTLFPYTKTTTIDIQKWFQHPTQSINIKMQNYKGLQDVKEARKTMKRKNLTVQELKDLLKQKNPLFRDKENILIKIEEYLYSPNQTPTDEHLEQLIKQGTYSPYDPTMSYLIYWIMQHPAVGDKTMEAYKELLKTPKGLLTKTSFLKAQAFFSVAENKFAPTLQKALNQDNPTGYHSITYILTLLLTATKHNPTEITKHFTNLNNDPHFTHYTQIHQFIKNIAEGCVPLETFNEEKTNTFILLCEYLKFIPDSYIKPYFEDIFANTPILDHLCGKSIATTFSKEMFYQTFRVENSTKT